MWRLLEDVTSLSFVQTQEISEEEEEKKIAESFPTAEP
jgi:hypothetical protein